MLSQHTATQSLVWAYCERSILTLANTVFDRRNLSFTNSNQLPVVLSIDQLFSSLGEVHCKDWTWQDASPSLRLWFLNIAHCTILDKIHHKANHGIKIWFYHLISMITVSLRIDHFSENNPQVSIKRQPNKACDWAAFSSPPFYRMTFLTPVHMFLVSLSPSSPSCPFQFNPSSHPPSLSCSSIFISFSHGTPPKP